MNQQKSKQETYEMEIKHLQNQIETTNKQTEILNDEIKKIDKKQIVQLLSSNQEYQDIQQKYNNLEEYLSKHSDLENLKEIIIFQQKLTDFITQSGNKELQIVINYIEQLHQLLKKKEKQYHQQEKYQSLLSKLGKNSQIQVDESILKNIQKQCKQALELGQDIGLEQIIKDQIVQASMYPTNDEDFWNKWLILFQKELHKYKANKLMNLLNDIINGKQVLDNFDFPQHDISKFQKYVELQFKAFRIDKDIYIYNQEGGWCDYNGCSYDCNCQPNGWYQILPNQTVIRYNQQKQIVKEMNLEDLSWLCNQIIIQSQHMSIQSAKKVVESKVNQFSSYKQWELIKQLLKLETNGVEIN